MIRFFDYHDFYNILPVSHCVDEERFKELFESLQEDDTYEMDYYDLCRLVELVCGEKT